MAWKARNLKKRKAKTYGQKLPLLLKTRDLLITKRGNLEPQFEFQVQKLHEGHCWKDKRKHKIMKMKLMKHLVTPSLF